MIVTEQLKIHHFQQLIVQKDKFRYSYQCWLCLWFCHWSVSCRITVSQACYHTICKFWKTGFCS